MNRSIKTAILILFFISPLFIWYNVESKENEFVKEENVKVMTYNVYGYRPLHPRRTKTLIELIENSNAHIIALQEAKPWFLKKLLKRPKIKSEYSHTPITRRYSAKGSLIVLSKFPIKSSSYLRQPGRRNKIMLLTRVINGNEIIPVINVHLESPLKAMRLRRLQLNNIFKKVRWSQNAIILGDFNFGDADVESSAIPMRFIDLWRSLKNDRDGYTWDMKKNVLALKHAYKRETSRRLDRILVHHSSWEPVKVKLAGKKPIRLRESVIYPSDHFALIGIIRSL